MTREKYNNDKNNRYYDSSTKKLFCQNNPYHLDRCFLSDGEVIFCYFGLFFLLAG